MPSACGFPALVLPGLPLPPALPLPELPVIPSLPAISCPLD